MDRATKNMTESTGRKWRKIGDNRKEIHSLDIAGTLS